MTLPTSGPLSINAIRTEMSSTSGSLRTLSAAAGFSTPDAMSDFYGYNNNVTISVYGKTTQTYTSNLSAWRFCYRINGGAIQYLSNGLGTGLWNTTCALRFTFQFPKGASLDFGTYWASSPTDTFFAFGGSPGSACPPGSTIYCGPDARAFGVISGNTSIALNVNLIGSTAATRTVTLCA